MDFKLLQQCNKEIKTTDIKGKAYAEVNQRIKVFRMLYPEGCISTKIESLVDGVVVMSATAKDELGNVLGVGHAYEKEDSSFINKTSFIENCETSAVGRALGMIGIGIDTSLCSADELLNALEQQENEKPISETHIKTLERCIPQHGQTIENVCRVYKVQSLKELTIRQFIKLMHQMGEE